MNEDASSRPSLPPAVPVTAAAVTAMAGRHGLPLDRAELVASAGMINTVFVVGDHHVLRVPRDHPGHVDQTRREAAAIPVAVSAGVRTPTLAAFDDGCDILPVPYLIVERARGIDADTLDPAPQGLPEAWAALGRDLARLHQTPVGAWPTAEAGPDETGDPRRLAERRAADGWITAREVRRLHTWLDHLEPLAPPPDHDRCLHGDVQLSNVLLDPGTLRYESLLDWGCARRGDPALDCRVVPLATVAPLLDGYRSVAGGQGSELTEARILWRRIQLALAVLPRGAAPGTAWGERPLAWILDLLFHLSAATDERWRALVPPA